MACREPLARLIGACLATTPALAALPHGFADAAATKPVITGFIDMQNIAWHNENDGKPKFTLRYVENFPGMFGGIVLNATWAEMQETAGGRLRAARIEKALREVRDYNAANPTEPLGVKLRIFAGNQAPPWAKAINGGPVRIKRNPKGCHTADCTITIGKVWDPQYIAAWRAFQDAVAARYDSEPLIRSVAITSCAMETDEPFVMPVKQRVRHGYTDAAQEACLQGAVDDYAAWQTTPIDYTINSFMRLQGGGFDPDFSISVMNACRAALGPRCELGNHGFGADMPLGNTRIVVAISALGAPIHYQTVGPKDAAFVSWNATVQAARDCNATALELWPNRRYGGFTTLTTAELQALVELFNSSPSTGGCAAAPQ